MSDNSTADIARSVIAEQSSGGESGSTTRADFAREPMSIQQGELKHQYGVDEDSSPTRKAAAIAMLEQEQRPYEMSRHGFIRRQRDDAPGSTRAIAQDVVEGMASLDRLGVTEETRDMARLAADLNNLARDVNNAEHRHVLPRWSQGKKFGEIDEDAAIAVVNELARRVRER